jgi:hypothetical protein
LISRLISDIQVARSSESSQRGSAAATSLPASAGVSTVSRIT